MCFFCNQGEYPTKRIKVRFPEMYVNCTKISWKTVTNVFINCGKKWFYLHVFQKLSVEVPWRPDIRMAVYN